MTDISGNASFIYKFATILILCLAGAGCGLVYAYLSFGFMYNLLIAGVISGILITATYILLEFALNHNSSASIFRHYVYRVAGYFVFFLFCLGLISFLHAFYSHSHNFYPLKNIITEDYLPHWPAFVIYALLAALIFQCRWLFNKLSGRKLAEEQTVNLQSNKSKAAVMAISLRCDDSVEKETEISILNRLSAEFINERKDAVISYENSVLKICAPGKSLSANEFMRIMNKMAHTLHRHMPVTQKMPELYAGYANGDVYFQQCGTQQVFTGTPVVEAEKNMRLIKLPTGSFKSSIPAFPLS